MKEQVVIDSLDLKVSSVTVVHGGDINKAFCVDSTSGKYFLKINDAARYPEMFSKEAAGLAALNVGTQVRAPKVVRCGVVSGQQFLLLEWLERGAPASGAWEKLGSGLASIHKSPQRYFGWEEDNYIGSLLQSNEAKLSWAEFYGERRILPLVRKLRDHGRFQLKDIAGAESFCNRLAEIYPSEHPSLLHGDLWSGNVMFDQGGSACMFDPAVYCGHREVDIAMTKLFGGFDERFYEGYNTTYPLERGWGDRLGVSQLYPILVHAVLFGGRYVSQATDIIKKF